MGRLDRTKVEVHERLDGSLAVYYRGHCLAVKPAPPETPVLRARSAARVMPGMANSDKLVAPIIKAKKTPQPKLTHYTKPGPDHPWRRPLRIHIVRG